MSSKGVEFCDICKSQISVFHLSNKNTVQSCHSCGSNFHLNHISSWVNQNDKCPNCRQFFSSGSAEIKSTIPKKQDNLVLDNYIDPRQIIKYIYFAIMAFFLFVIVIEVLSTDPSEWADGEPPWLFTLLGFFSLNIILFPVFAIIIFIATPKKLKTRIRPKELQSYTDYISQISAATIITWICIFLVI